MSSTMHKFKQASVWGCRAKGTVAPYDVDEENVPVVERSSSKDLLFSFQG